MNKKPNLNITLDPELDATLAHLHSLMDPPDAFTSPTAKRKRRQWLVKYLLEEAVYALEDRLEEKGVVRLPLRFTCEEGEERRGAEREKRVRAIERLLNQID